MRADDAAVGYRAEHPSSVAVQARRGKDDIVLALQVRALGGQAAALPGCDDLPSLAVAYRAWAITHPRLYELVSRHTLDRSRLPEGLEDTAAAPLMEAAQHDAQRARALWAPGSRTGRSGARWSVSRRCRSGRRLGSRHRSVSNSQ